MFNKNINWILELVALAINGKQPFENTFLQFYNVKI